MGCWQLRTPEWSKSLTLGAMRPLMGLWRCPALTAAAGPSSPGSQRSPASHCCHLLAGPSGKACDQAAQSPWLQDQPVPRLACRGCTQNCLPWIPTPDLSSLPHRRLRALQSPPQGRPLLREIVDHLPSPGDSLSPGKRGATCDTARTAWSRVQSGGTPWWGQGQGGSGVLQWLKGPGLCFTGSWLRIGLFYSED